METKPTETLDDAAVLEPAKPYRVGTLSYTKTGLAVIFFWLLWGDLCFTLMETVIPTVLPVKLGEFGAPAWMILLVTSAMPQIINVFMNPVISFKSDRHRGPRGRRIPFITATMPLLMVLLLGVGYGDCIGALLTRHNADYVSVLAIGVMMVCFSVANMFVGSVFYYLFNDVVPPQFLARFLSMFRTVGIGAAAFFQFFILPLADQHTHEIFIGAALLYLVGFSLMCWKVKEGQYPPPPEYVEGERGLVAAIKTYWRECFSLAHYRYVFLIAFGVGGTMACNTLMWQFNEATGLTLRQFGIVGGVNQTLGAFVILATGWLADRFHPIRIVIAGLILQVFLATPATCAWLFLRMSPETSFHYWLVITVVLNVPAFALWTMLDPPLFMRIFPRDRLGQFCSANAITRAISVNLNALVLGGGFIVLHRLYGGHSYVWLPIGQFVSFGLMLAGTLLLYRSWKRYGGDAHYVPPIRSHAARPPGVETASE